MKRLALFICLFCCTTLQIDAESDSRSAKMLNQMVAKYRSYKGLDISFLMTYIDSPSTLGSYAFPDTSKWENGWSGQFMIKDSCYRLTVPSMEVLYDGIHFYQYLPEVREINKMGKSYDEGDFSLFAHPDRFFISYTDYFDARFVKEIKQNGKLLYEIKLTPKQKQVSTYTQVFLWIEVETGQPVVLRTESKDTPATCLFFKQIVDQTAWTAQDFEFRISSYPKGTELIDMTF